MHSLFVVIDEPVLVAHGKGIGDPHADVLIGADNLCTESDRGFTGRRGINAGTKHLVTPAKAGAHRRNRSRPSPG